MCMVSAMMAVTMAMPCPWPPLANAAFGMVKPAAMISVAASASFFIRNLSC